MSIRFAASIPGLEQFMSGPNMGGLAQGATDLRSEGKAIGYGLLGKVGGAGIRAKGQAISGELLGDAQAAAGRSRMMGQIFQTLGQVGGKAVGSGMFGGGNFEFDSSFPSFASDYTAPSGINYGEIFKP